MSKELTQRQKDTLKKHSKHHSAKHMAMMKKAMKNDSILRSMIDKTFSCAMSRNRGMYYVSIHVYICRYM